MTRISLCCGDPVNGSPRTVRPREAFQMLGIGETTGFAMMRDGRLERVQLGPRAVAVTMDSIRRLVEERIGAKPRPA